MEGSAFAHRLLKENDSGGNDGSLSGFLEVAFVRWTACPQRIDLHGLIPRFIVSSGPGSLPLVLLLHMELLIPLNVWVARR